MSQSTGSSLDRYAELPEVSSANRRRYANRIRTESLLLGGVAGFLGLVEVTFWGLVDSVIGGGIPLATAAFGAIGLVGAAIAKHRPRGCAAFELIAGIGLLFGGHIILGSLFLAGATLALASLRMSPPAARTGATVHADLASAFTLVGVAGLAIVAGLSVLGLGLLALAVALSDASSDGVGAVTTALFLTIVVATVLAIVLLVRRACRRD